MRREITNNELFVLKNDIDNIERNSPGLAFLLGQKINMFRRQNAMVLNILKLKLKTIKEQYCMKDEDGKAITVLVDGSEQLQYPDKESEEQCASEITEFLNRSIMVEI